MEKFIEFEGHKYEIPPSVTPKRTILFLRHLADYKFISTYVEKASVLDVGCGYGYGSSLLSIKAKKVLGVDTSCEQIKKANELYKTANLEFVVGDATKLDKSVEPTEKFDIVVAMQLLEHLPSPELFIESAKSVTKKNGLIIISTPNRLLRLKDGQKPWNSDHIREYDPISLADFLGKYFKNIKFYSLLGSKKVSEFSETITGGSLPSSFKTLWRYTPEPIRCGVRKIIDSKIKSDNISLDDYEIVEGAQSEGISFFAFCYKS